MCILKEHEQKTFSFLVWYISLVHYLYVFIEKVVDCFSIFFSIFQMHRF